MFGLYIDSGMCKCTEKYEPEHLYCYSGPCSVTGEPITIEIPAQGLFNIRQGMGIKEALPEMNANDREFILTGISAKGWEKIFGKNPEEN